MKTRYLIRYLLAALFLTAWCSNAGCGAGGSAPADAGAGAGSFDHPATGFGGPIAPQGGTITSITGTSGVTGSCAAGPCSLSADTTFVQKRVTGTCASGLAIGTVNADGTVSCNTAGISGTGTAGDLSVWATSSSLGNYAGSTATACGAGNATTNIAIGANGALTNTCSTLAAIGAAAGTGTLNVLPHWSNTTGGLVDSLLKDDGTTFSVNTNKFTVTEANGNANAAGTFTSGSTLTVSAGGVAVTGTSTMQQTTFTSNAVGVAASVTANWTGTAVASDRESVLISNTGTYDATTAPRTAYGVKATVNAVRSAGTNAVNQVALYGTTVGGSGLASYALQTDVGDTYLSTTSGNVGVGYTLGSALSSKFNVSGTAAITGALTADGGLRVHDAVGTGLSASANTVSLNINGGTTQTCGAGQATTSITGVGIISCSTFSTLTNSAGANVVTKSDGTNLVASSITDNGAGTVNLGNNVYTYNTNGLSFGYTSNNLTSGVINYYGYNGGTTQYRDLGIYDGKSNLIEFIQGSTKATSHLGYEGNGYYLVNWWDTAQFGQIMHNLLTRTDNLLSEGSSDCTFAGGAGSWAWCASGAQTVTSTTTAQTSPRGISESVQNFTCTDNVALCASGGVTYQVLTNSTLTNIADVRSSPFAASVWIKASTGTPTITLDMYRDGGSDHFATGTCALNSSTWTRCSVSGTTSATSLTDNSAIRFVITNVVSGTTYYMTGAQLEQGLVATGYQWNDLNTWITSKVATKMGTTGLPTYGMFTPSLSIGNTEQDPDYWIGRQSGTPEIVSGSALSVIAAGDITLNGGNINLTTSGNVAVTGTLSTTGMLSVPSITMGMITPTLPASPVNDWSPAGLGGAKYIYVNPSASTLINGIDSTGVTAGRELCLVNTSASFYVGVQHQNTGSLAANRITTPGHTIWYLRAGQSGAMCFVYDTTLQWNLLADDDAGVFTWGGGAGTLSTNGNITAVSITNSLTTINGLTGLNTLTVHHSTTAQTSSENSIVADHTSSYNTTSGALGAISVQAANTATVSSGTNTLTDYGLYASATGVGTHVANLAIYATASGGTVSNTALQTDAGSILLLQTGGNLTIGAAANNAHVTFPDGSSRPTLSGCGTSPTIVGSDTSGKVTIGTGGATACVITFHTSYSSNASCVPARRQGAITSYSLSTTALTVNGTFAASDILDYDCADH